VTVTEQLEQWKLCCSQKQTCNP